MYCFDDHVFAVYCLPSRCSGIGEPSVDRLSQRGIHLVDRKVFPNPECAFHSGNITQSAEMPNEAAF